MEEWEHVLGDTVHIKYLLEFVASEADILERMLASGHNEVFFKNIESIARKFQNYEDRVRPIQEYFAGKHECIKSHKDTSAVFMETCRLFNSKK